MDIDRRAAVVLGLSGLSALLLGSAKGAAAAEAKEIAPGVTLKVLNKMPSEIPGFPSVQWREITWQPGASLGPITMKNAMICEVTAGSLEQTVKGKGTKMLQTGDNYFCHDGTIETDVNKGTAPSTMRVIDLLTA